MTDTQDHYFAEPIVLPPAFRNEIRESFSKLAMNSKSPRAIAGFLLFTIHELRFHDFTTLPPCSDLLGVVPREDAVAGIDDAKDKSQHLMTASRVCLLIGRRAGTRIFVRFTTYDSRITITHPFGGTKREKKEKEIAVAE